MIYNSQGSLTKIENVKGLNFRTPKQGPEVKLVQQYIETNLPLPRSGQCRSIFLEPKLESGYPDAVVVYWNLAIAEQWDNKRLELTTADLRLLQYLSTFRSSTVPQLIELYGTQIYGNIEHLFEAKLIKKRGKNWAARPLNSIFAVRRIISIEAKLDDWRQGLIQTVQNTWFASESYLLLPQLKKRTNVIDEVSRFGVGLITLNCRINVPVVKSNRFSLPRSYASWLFNEWVWRMSK